MQKQTPRKTYAFVGDGETEQWYLQMLKKNETNLTVTIKPELPQDKSIEDQFAYVQELSAIQDKVITEIKKHTPLTEYDKTKKYYQQAYDIYKRLKPYLTAARTNAAKTGSFNPDVLEKGLSDMQKIFEELGV